MQPIPRPRVVTIEEYPSPLAEPIAGDQGDPIGGQAPLSGGRQRIEQPRRLGRSVTLWMLLLVVFSSLAVLLFLALRPSFGGKVGFPRDAKPSGSLGTGSGPSGR